MQYDIGITNSQRASSRDCNGQPLWLPGGSWNLGGFERALDQRTMRLSGTDGDCLFRALTRVCVPRQPKMGISWGCCPATEFFLHAELESDLKWGTDDEADQVHRRADHRGFARARGRSEDDRSSAQARHFGSHAVQLEGQIWRHGDIGREASAIA